jgi:hypothetical protein
MMNASTMKLRSPGNEKGFIRRSDLWIFQTHRLSALFSCLGGFELVLGLVGKFWTFTGKIERVDASQYFQFSTRGYAKVAWNFAIDESGQGVVRLSTETRVKCTDGHSRRRFTLYWFLVGHFSRLIRKEILRCVKKSVELT